MIRGQAKTIGASHRPRLGESRSIGLRSTNDNLAAPIGRPRALDDGDDDDDTFGMDFRRRRNSSPLSDETKSTHCTVTSTGLPVAH